MFCITSLALLMRASSQEVKDGGDLEITCRVNPSLALLMRSSFDNGGGRMLSVSLLYLCDILLIFPRITYEGILPMVKEIGLC